MVVGLLSWWEEEPTWLIRAVSALTRFCGHVIVVDGAYENMPGAYDTPRSSGVQADAVVAAANGAGLTLHQPLGPWVGDQVAKRTFMFRLAALITEPGDWLFVVDADEIVTDVPADLEEQLARAAAEGYEACTVDQTDLPARGIQPSRRFYLADPTLRVEGAHYRFIAGPPDEPRLVRGDERQEPVLPAYPVRGFRFEHLSSQRHPLRRKLQRDYYTRRTALVLER